MKSPEKSLSILLALALAGLVAGCNHTISESKTVRTSSDGTVKSKETTVTQRADGTIEKKEETKTTRP